MQIFFDRMVGRPLSKSRYRLGLECPTKIFYSLNSDTYLNRNKDSDFLNAEDGCVGTDLEF